MREYRVWLETGDLWGEYNSAPRAERAVRSAREWCRRNGCHTDGSEQTPGKGDFKCGTFEPHGVSLQVLEDGQDVTQDYLING